jgi:hypothetical protein
MKDLLDYGESEVALESEGLSEERWREIGSERSILLQFMGCSPRHLRSPPLRLSKGVHAS